MKSSAFRPLTNRPSPIGYDGGQLHDVDIDGIAELDALGVHRRGGTATLLVLDRDPNGVLDDALAGVPIALERLAGEAADLPAVREEHDFLHLPPLPWRVDHCHELEDAADHSILDR